MIKQKARTVSGAVLMLDLDFYLDRVRHLSSGKEWQFVEPIYAAVEVIAAKHEFHLVRSFGDGFLLYALGEPDQSLFQKAITFIFSLRDELAKHSFDFKAALSAGTLVLVQRRTHSEEMETVIAGAVANTVGKAIRKASRGMLAINWPLDNVADSAETFDSIGTSASRRTASVPIIKLAPSLDPFSIVSIEEKTPTSPAESVAFSAGVKNIVFDTIKMADDKAKAIFAVSGGFLVYLFNGRVNPTEFFVLCEGSHLTRLVSWLVAMALFFASSFFALRVLYPRTGTTHKGLLFYGSIREWGSADEYAERIQNSSSSELAYESAAHNFDISGVATRKYAMLRRSIWTMGLGIVAALAFLFTQWLLFPAPPA